MRSGHDMKVRHALHNEPGIPRVMPVAKETAHGLLWKSSLTVRNPLSCPIWKGLANKSGQPP